MTEILAQHPTSRSDRGPRPATGQDQAAGGNLSIEFTGDAPDDDQPRLGAWRELRAADPAA